MDNEDRNRLKKLIEVAKSGGQISAAARSVLKDDMYETITHLLNENDALIHDIHKYADANTGLINEPSIPVKDLEKLVDAWRAPCDREMSTQEESEILDSYYSDCANQLNDLIKKVDR